MTDLSVIRGLLVRLGQLERTPVVKETARRVVAEIDRELKGEPPTGPSPLASHRAAQASSAPVRIGSQEA